MNGLNHFLKFVGKTELNDLSLADFSSLRIYEFKEYLKNRVSQNSIKTYLTQLQSYCNLRNINVDFKRVRTKNIKSTNVYLSVDFLQEMENEKNLNPRLEDIKNLFLLQAWTGARMSDVIKFDSKNIKGDFLEYTSQKTKTLVRVPIKPIVKKILSKKITAYDKMSYNRGIKKLCKLIGFNEQVKLIRAGKEVTDYAYNFVSSHTARRSFATNLYNSGIPLLKISHLMGHSNTKMTENYICNLQEVDNDILEFFK